MYVPPPCPPPPPRAWADKRKAGPTLHILYPTLHILYPPLHILYPTPNPISNTAHPPLSQGNGLLFSQQGYSHCRGRKTEIDRGGSNILLPAPY